MTRQWHCLAVITALLFLLALVQGCMAAGGDEHAESAYISFLITNRFIYDLTHNDTNPSEETVHSWVRKIAEFLKVKLRYTQRLATILINRSYHMRKMMKKLKGGAPRQRFFLQSWALELEPSEVEAVEHQDRNAEVEEVVKSLQEENKEMKKKVLSLNNKLKEVSSHETRRQYKSVDDLGDRQKRRLKRARSSSCKASLGWLDGEGYTPISVQVLNNSTKQVEKIELESVEELLGDSSETDTNDLDLLDMMLFVKDSYSVSDNAYHEMAQLCKQLPRQYKIKERIKELNKLWNIKPLPNDVEGVQQSLEDRLKVRIEHLVRVSPRDSEFMKLKQLHVKLSGDGTSIGKRLHVVCFTFTVLEECETTGSYEGNHVLAVFKTPEKYTFLKMALEDIIKGVEKLKQVKVDQDTFSVDYYMGGDWKFLASITGIDSASSTYSCIWCKCARDERVIQMSTSKSAIFSLQLNK